MVRSIHKLFVSNLPWTVGNLQLKNYFKELGLKVSSVNVVFDKNTGLSQKYGFVEINKDQLSLLEDKNLKLEGNKLFFQSAQ